MLNFKTKSMLMGATSFLMAFLVLTVLTVVNKETKDGLSFLKTTAVETVVNLGVCSYYKSDITSDTGYCDVTDSETFTATAGIYDIYADITRGPADQTEESFELSLNGVSLGEFKDDGVDGTTKTLLASDVTITESNTLEMEHLVPTESTTVIPNSVSITKIYLDDGVVGDDTCTIKINDSTGTEQENFTLGSTGKMAWTASIGNTSAIYYSCFYGDDYEGTKKEGQVQGTSGEIDLTFSSTKTGPYYCLMSLFDSDENHLNKDSSWGATCADATNIGTTYSCTGTVPSNASLCSNDSTDLTANTEITLKSACTEATKCEYTCSSGYSYDSTTGTCVANNGTDTCTIKINDSTGTEQENFTLGSTGKMAWTASIGNTSAIYYSCFYGDDYEGTKKEGQVQGTSGEIDLTFSSTKTGPYYCLMSLFDVNGNHLNKDSSWGATCADATNIRTTTTPTCSISFYDSTNTNSITSMTVPGTAYMRWSSENASSVKAYCEGPIPVYSATAPEEMGLSNSAYGPVEFDSSHVGTQTCYCIPYNGDTSGTKVSATLTLSGSTYSCTGTVPSNASLCSNDSTDLTANTEITLKSACTEATKCEYTCSSGYGYDSTTGTCIASTNGSCGSASKTYSSSSTSYGTDTFCTAGTASPTSPTFPTTSSSTSWSCVGSNGGSTASCKASLSSVITNGACGSANGTTVSSAPTSNLCSAGNASSVSGSGPWTWTCSGINGGTNISCSANITTTTTSTIPVTSYTYSYTTKVAPTSGPATNVALLLSISAVVTLGVWMAVKKIKG